MRDALLQKLLLRAEQLKAQRRENNGARAHFFHSIGMKTKKEALIVYGGWEGHQPKEVAAVFVEVLRREGFAVSSSDSLASFDDASALKQLDLIVPIWTMGEISKEQCHNISEAVAEGTGLAGCHGGMCDAFRQNELWQFMTGGNWVAHPGGNAVEHVIQIRASSSPLTDGLSDFKVCTEQYYLHVDPAVEVLATTRFPVANGYHAANGAVDVPQVWTKRWGLGRIFYNALGHDTTVLRNPSVSELMRRGFKWCAAGKTAARELGLNADIYRDPKQ